jgi:hypothetical protein
VADATRIVCTCQGCQFYARQTHLPAQALQTIPITWSFAVWGLDLIGPLQKAPGGYTHLLVAIDKFSKWIEVRPLNNIRSEQAVAFFTNIIHRFGVPNSIITDNGTQFTGKKFLDFCEDHHILGGQLAEATERPVKPSARVGFLEETLAAMAQARCSYLPSRWRSSDCVVVRGRVGFRRRWGRCRGCCCSPY